MIISDLNYLETAEETVEGGYRGRSYRFRKDVKTDVKVRLDVKKRVAAKIRIKGNLADAEALAEADGYNSVAETLTDTYANDYYSLAYSGSISAVN